jgi:hypothetical protein
MPACTVFAAQRLETQPAHPENASRYLAGVAAGGLYHVLPNSIKPFANQPMQLPHHCYHGKVYYCFTLLQEPHPQFIVILKYSRCNSTSYNPPVPLTLYVLVLHLQNPADVAAV